LRVMFGKFHQPTPVWSWIDSPLHGLLAHIVLVYEHDGDIIGLVVFFRCCRCERTPTVRSGLTAGRRSLVSHGNSESSRSSHPRVDALWSSVSCIHCPELVQWHLFVCFRYDISLFPRAGKDLIAVSIGATRLCSSWSNLPCRPTSRATSGGPSTVVQLPVRQRQPS
jgi:hypothetical protein